MRHRVVANVGALTVARISGALLSALTVAIAARAAGPAEFGRLSYALVFVAMFTAWTDHGFNLVVARLGAADPSRLPLVLGNGLVIKFLTGTALAGAAVLTASAVVPRELLLPIAIASGLVLVTSLTVVNVFFQIHLRMGTVGMVEVGAKLLALAGVAAVWASNAVSAERLLTVQVLATAAGVAMLFRLTVAAARPVWRTDRAIWRAIFIGAAPLTIAFALSTVYNRFDVLALERLVGAEAVGLYAVPARVVDVFLLLPGLTMNVFFPLFVERLHRGQAAFTSILRQTLDVMLALAIPLALVTAFAAPDLVVLAGGARFARAAPALVVLAFALVPIFYATVVGHAVIAAGRERVLVAMAILGIATAAVGTLTLIPRWGLVGAAAATAVTHTVLAAANALYVWRRLGVVPVPRSPIAIAVVSAVFGVALWGLSAVGIGTWPALAGGVAAGSLAVLAVPQLRGEALEALAAFRDRSSSPQSTAPTSDA